MKIVLALAFFAAVAHGHTIPPGRVMIPDSIQMNSDEMINFINSMGTTWKVSEKERKSLNYKNYKIFTFFRLAATLTPPRPSTASAA